MVLHPYKPPIHHSLLIFFKQVFGISMLKYRELHGKEMSTEQGAGADFFAAFMQIYGLERRNEECTCGAIELLMAYYAFTVHGIFSIGLESSFQI